MKKFQLSSHLPLVLLALLAFLAIMTFTATSSVAQKYITMWDTRLGDGSDAITIKISIKPGKSIEYYWEDENGTKLGTTILSEGNHTISRTFQRGGIYTLVLDPGFVIRGIDKDLMSTNNSTASSNIGGDLHMYFDDDGTDTPKKLIEVAQWGRYQWSSTHKMFNGCTNLTRFPPSNTKPNLSWVQDMSYMFHYASKFNSDISNWDVSNVTNMGGMFRFAEKFNSPLNKWGDNVSNVTNMGAMFAGATEFNQPLDSWDVSSVKNMIWMFYQAKKFNQPLNSWGDKVSNVTDMAYMFLGASVFNQPLDRWNVSNVKYMGEMFRNAEKFNNSISWGDAKNVENMSFMFAGATSFNQPLNSWRLSAVSNMANMFDGATSFNQPLNNWNVANVESMNHMFKNAKKFNGSLSWTNVRKVRNMNGMFQGATAFNQPLNSWQLSAVSNMAIMFDGATSFNQPLNNWNVANVESMFGMFGNAKKFNSSLSWTNVKKVRTLFGMFVGATAFNKPLNTWELSAVSNMSFMFNGASAFDQSLGSWDVSKVENMTNMLSNSGMKTPNYDATLKEWSKQNLQRNVTLSGGPFYCDSEAEREKIKNDYGWDIRDKGRKCTKPNIHLKQKPNNNVTIKPSQAVPVNFGHIAQNDSKTITLTIFNNRDDDVKIDEIKFINSKKKYVLSKKLPTNKKIIPKKSESDPISITLNSTTAGLESDMLVVKATAVITGGRGETLEFGFPLTGKVGDIPASIYHTDAVSNQQINSYAIYKSAIDKPARTPYFAFGVREGSEFHTNNIAIDTVNNLMFWTTTYNSGQIYELFIVSGLMDGEKLINESLKIIHRVVYRADEIISMGLAVNPKSRHLYFSFSSGDLGRDGSFMKIQRIGYDDTQPSDNKIDELSSHLACDNAGNLYFADGKSIKRANPDLSSSRQFYTGSRNITGLSIDPWGKRLYFVEDGVLKHVSLNNPSATTNISNNFKQVTSIVHSRKENRVYYTLDGGTSEKEIGYIDLKSKNKKTILQNGIQMPSAGRLALFPSTKGPKPKIEVKLIEVNSSEKDINNRFNIIRYGTHKIHTSDKVTRTFRVYNKGNANLKLSSITVTGSKFAITSGGIPPENTVNIGNNQFHEFKISLSKDVKGTYEERVKITSNNPTGDFNFNVKGTIEVPKIEVFDVTDTNNKIILSQTPSTVNFGSATRDDNQKIERKFVIENNSSVDLILKKISISNIDNVYTIRHDPIPTGGKVLNRDSEYFKFFISLDRKKAGNFDKDKVTIVSDDPDNPDFEIELKGKITKPKIAVYEGTDKNGKKLTSTSTAQFGTNKKHNTESVTKQFVIYNEGDAPLAITKITLPANYSTTLPTTFTLQANENRAFPISLSRKNAGDFNGTVSIESNASGGNFTFKVAGKITEPKIAVYEGTDKNGKRLSSTSTAQFGTNTKHNTESVTKQFVIYNNGGAPLAITKITLPANYSTTLPTTFTLQANENRAFPISLSRKNAGDFNGTVSIESNASGGNFTFKVAGKITEPKIAVYEGTDKNGKRLSSTSTAQFGTNTKHNTESVTKQFVIYNNGGAPLAITKITLPANYSTTLPTTFTLQANENRAFPISLSRKNAGNFNGTVSIESNASGGNFTFKVAGKITEPKIAVYEGTDKNGKKLSSTSTTQFGTNTKHNTKSVTKQFVIYNKGDAPLGITKITLPANYSTTLPTTFTLQANENRAFPISLSRKNAGDFNGTVSIESNASGGNFTFKVAGKITEPKIAVYEGTDDTGKPLSSTSTAQFGTNTIHNTKSVTKQFVIYNNGGAPLAITKITLPANYSTTLPTTFTLQANENRAFPISLSRKNAGNFNGTVSIESNASGGNFTFKVAGKITEPKIAVYEGTDKNGKKLSSTSTTQFGTNTKHNTKSVTKQFVIYNKGDAPLGITKITLPANYSTTLPTTFTLQANENRAFPISLSRKNAGDFNGTVSIESNASGGNFTFKVAGKITEPKIAVYEGTDKNGKRLSSTSTAQFGTNTKHNTESVTKQFVIYNNGGAPLAITKITLPANYSTTLPTTFTLQANENRAFPISLSRKNAGNFNGTVSIESNASGGNFTFKVAGKITKILVAQFAVYHNGNKQNSPLSINFDSHIQDPDNKVTKDFEIKNIGSASLKITNIKLENDKNAYSKAHNNIPANGITLNRTNNPFKFSISLSRKNIGNFNGKVTIEYEDRAQKQFIINLKGEITEPKTELAVKYVANSSNQQIDINQDRDNPLGTFDSYKPHQQDFYIRNIGNFTLNIKNIQISSNGNISKPNTTSATIQKNSASKFSVNLSNNKAGDHKATITISSNATTNPYKFDVSWTTSPPKAPITVIEGKKQNGKIIVTNSTIDMGSTPLSENITKTYGINNPTQSDINNIKIKSDNPLFEVKNAPSTIPKGQSRNFDVVLIATKRGTQSGNITISSDIFTHTFVVKGEVTFDNTIVVYNVVTPNGDDIHDYLKIKNIHHYPNNKVTIFNRWGDVVYEMEKYDNDNERKRFDGTANKSGTDLITGNYYYAIDLGDGSKVITGFLFLKK